MTFMTQSSFPEQENERLSHTNKQTNKNERSTIMKGKKAVLLVEKTLQKHLDKHPPCRPGCNEKEKCKLAEKALQNHLVKHPPDPYKDLAEREWSVEPGRADKGKGDLVFSHGKKEYLVVETKNLPTATGRTARTSRTQRRHVVRQ